MICRAQSGEIWGRWYLVLVLACRTTPIEGRPTKAIRITDAMMTLEIGNRVVATARVSEHGVADDSAWIVSTHRPGRCGVTHG
jgi:hypothetical protein